MRPRNAATLKACTSTEELRGLAPYWDGLGTFMNAPYGRYSWALSCAETLTGTGRLFVPFVVDDERPIAAAPLVKPHNRLAAARQLGVEWHGEPGDFNYRDCDALQRLCESLASNHVALLLARVPVESPVVPALSAAYHRRGIVLTRPQPSCPYIEIDETEEQTLAALPSRLRSDLRRASRKAEQYGEMSLDVRSPGTREELLPLWDEALRVEAAGWKGRSRSALEMNPRVSPFYEAYVARACQQSTARIFLLRLGSETAAMMIAVEAEERLWVLKIGYDERFAKGSPGMLVMKEGLRYAARHDLASFEFLGADAEWTHRWTNRERPTVRIFACPFSLTGAAALLHEAVGRAGQRLGRHSRDAS